MVSLNLLDSAWWNITTYQMHGGGETKHPCGTSHLATLRGSIEPIVYPVPKSLSGVREEAARETDRPCQSGCNDVFLSMFQNKTASKKTRLLQKDQTFSYHVVLIVPGCIRHPYLLTRCFLHHLSPGDDFRLFVRYISKWVAQAPNRQMQKL